MERNWYKLIDGVWTIAPQQKVLEDGIMYNYNCDANEAMLREDGYLPEDVKQLVTEKLNENETTI